MSDEEQTTPINQENTLITPITSIVNEDGTRTEVTPTISATIAIKEALKNQNRSDSSGS